MRTLAAALTALLVLACASGDTNNASKADVELVQLQGPQELNWPRGRFEVQYGLRITNRTAEQITLREIVLEPGGGGGAYRVLRERYPFTVAIPSGATQETAFWARALGSGNKHAVDAYAPVTVRALVEFEAPSGAFRRVMVQTFR